MKIIIYVITTSCFYPSEILLLVLYAISREQQHRRQTLSIEIWLELRHSVITTAHAPILAQEKKEQEINEQLLPKQLLLL